jgi:acyl transferase domain-containing protein/acyl carrier protein
MDGTEIAIIGLAGRFPGARNVDQFWRNLRDGVESITFFTDQELESMGVDRAVLRDPHYVKAASIIDEVEMFDAAFFGYTPREAEIMDPQHRVLLECAWEAVENAGYDSDAYNGSIGVFAGATINTYLLENLASNPDLINSLDLVQINVANGGDFLTTRISYKLNLKGPSHLVQSACSTSLVAIHIACQSLLNEECDMALAGGVSVNQKLRRGYFYLEGGMSSPDGHCRAFDSRAQGTIFGSGVGVVVLKRLSDALADGDTLHAVIKGSAINNDGSLKVGYTAPSVDGQAQVIAEGLANAGVDVETITAVETHGTGTPLGDPIEVQALTKAFRAGTDKKGFCAIGSVKTNFGHLDAAAGVTGLIKTVLALQHKLLPPSLHFEQPNPNIDFANSPFYVNATLTEWNAGRTPRRAGVSSFGVGGTNAHVIVEEAPPVEPSGESRPWQLLVLSAKTGSAVETATANLVDYLKQHPNTKLADVAYTLQIGRRAFNHRRMVVCRNVDDAVNALTVLDPQRVFTGLQENNDRPVVFMFPGQGAQHVNMGLELYQVEPTFREPVDRCSERLMPHLRLDLRAVLYPSEDQIEWAAEQLNQTWLTQPALFVIEYALARLWMSWGVHPQAMIGHSIGEYVAACVAGVFSLDDALMLVATRGRLMQQQPAGAMLAVPLLESEVQPWLDSKLALAAINGPSQCVISGPIDEVNELEQRLVEEGLACRRLHTSHAFHSRMMDPILEPFTEQVKRIALKSPQIPYLSNVTGTWITEHEIKDPRYWAGQLRQTVRFADGLRELLKESNRRFLEVGPGHALSRMVRRHPSSTPERVVLASLPQRDQEPSEAAFALTMLGQLWLAGVPVDWSGLYAQERRHRLPLPTYPFERRRFWIEPRERANVDEVGVRRHAASGKQPDMADWFYIPSWKQSLLPRPLKPGEPAQPSHCWLVFVDECGLGSRLAKRLAHAGQPVIRVMRAEHFEALDDDLYAINPRSPDDYESLLKDLSSMNKIPNRIVHLWSLTPNNQPASGIEFFQEMQEAGLYSLLFLAQAFEKASLTDPLQIEVVSNHLHSVTDEEVVCPEKATLLGPCKVLPQEYPNIACRCIDVVAPQPGTRHEAKLIDQLIAEIAMQSSDGVIAYRGHQRWVQTFEPVRLGSDVEPIRPLRENGVYFITGGLSGIGLALAEYLARTKRARLILVESAAFPQRDRWAQWLVTHPDQDEVSRKIRHAQALEKLSPKVVVVSADVASEDHLRRAIATAVELFGELHGVIHAAAVVGGKSFRAIQETGPTECDWQFEPKVYGVLVLEKVLPDRELDFCVLVSSLSSVLGGLGSVAYASAHLFMDAWAHHHNKTSDVPWISVNWDAWQFADEEGKEHITAFSADLAQLAMTPEEGVEAFRRILSLSATSQIVLSTGDLQTRIIQWIAPRSFRGPASSTQAKPLSSLHPRPKLQTPYVAPSNDLERAIASLWQRALGIEKVGVLDNFFDLGGDSLIAIQAISHLKKELNMEIPVVSLYEGLTVRSLAELLSRDQDEAESPQGSITQVGERGERVLRRKRYQQEQRSKRAARR